MVERLCVISGCVKSTKIGNIIRQDVVEKTFKQLKGILGLRPIRFWLKNHVEGYGHPFHAINCVAFPSRGRKRLSAF